MTDYLKSDKIKSNIWNAGVFVLGVIVTIIITKVSDKISPEDPVLVKQLTDTVKIVHDFKIETTFNKDSSRKILEAKIKNLELLDRYDKLIVEKKLSIDKRNSIVPNLILTHNLSYLENKGFMYESSSGYFSAECPNANSDFIDIKLDFFNQSLIKDIALLRINIYKFENPSDKESKTVVSEHFYEVKPNNNLLRLSNEFEKGKYEILFGFMLKKDLQEKYPKFYFKRCILTK